MALLDEDFDTLKRLLNECRDFKIGLAKLKSDALDLQWAHLLPKDFETVARIEDLKGIANELETKLSSLVFGFEQAMSRAKGDPSHE